MSVLNLGLGGNCVLRGGLGPTANSRYQRDVLKQEGVKYAIVFEGVNDLGGSRDGEATAKELIESFKKMIGLAHEKGIKIYGATIMPFKGNGYYNESREKGRQMVNEWIRTSGEYDGVIDFDACVSQCLDPAQENKVTEPVELTKERSLYLMLLEDFGADVGYVVRRAFSFSARNLSDARDIDGVSVPAALYLTRLL